MLRRHGYVGPIGYKTRATIKIKTVNVLLCCNQYKWHVFKEFNTKD